MSSRKNLRTEITWCIIHILTKRVANDRNISSRRSFLYPRFFFLTYLLVASTSCSSASSQEACSINRDADKRKKNGLRRDIKNDLESDRICAPVGGGEKERGAFNSPSLSHILRRRPHSFCDRTEQQFIQKFLNKTVSSASYPCIFLPGWRRHPVQVMNQREARSFLETARYSWRIVLFPP